MMHLIEGVEKYQYIGSQKHFLLANDIDKACGPNIGLNGENLTISFLSLNRASLSIKLLESIDKYLPNFAGEILIVDNGSIRSEIILLKNFIKQLSLKIKLVELEKNFGVAGGRNKTIKYVNTDWLMCLDNDIYFITRRCFVLLNCSINELICFSKSLQRAFSC